ncbi:peroxiredoxin [Pistricoccus aurantiacus]|uniref:Thioredoxin peroxidase n=1 Tax=Pistricoccus aurantiacus TaxID=1883414 RepID=A0A5B8SVM8_9GAMM|nr:peroxiredoxin [Pistricoccus aurantiacus]QEA38770.1 peroxiredoxin [Pistricoccus aurantiacus]
MSVLVGRQAPNFEAAAVTGEGKIVENFKLSNSSGKLRVLFFWPLDFTFVCPSEIIAHDNRLPQFKELGVEVIGVSIDSQFTHYAWRKTSPDAGGIGEVGFPMVADVKHEIAQAYGIEHPEAGVALRASFLIDEDGIVQHQTVNNLPLGRNVDEMLRMVKALKHHQEHGEVCPAGWDEGEEGMQDNAEGVAKYLGKHFNEL